MLMRGLGCQRLIYVAIITLVRHAELRCDVVKQCRIDRARFIYNFLSFPIDLDKKTTANSLSRHQISRLIPAHHVSSIDKYLLVATTSADRQDPTT